MNEKSLTPKEIVLELDRFIIGQAPAKKSVAIALRNRWRRRKVAADLRDEIVPKNIIMMGPTGVGKTEIARRLARLADAPFLKVEATKFTEVGYVGKDVESMIRELTEMAIKMVREEESKSVQIKAKEQAEEKLLDLLLPGIPQKEENIAEDDDLPSDSEFNFVADAVSQTQIPEISEEKIAQAELDRKNTREKFRTLLREGKLDDRFVEVSGQQRHSMPAIEVVAAGSLEEMNSNLRDMFSNVFPSGKKKRKMKVQEALETLTHEEASRLIDMDNVTKLAIERVEQNGIVFIDEIDKIARSTGSGSGHGPDVSREGVQRDILPIIEGSSVTTKYGIVRTDHILFIAAGAFHSTKPSDLIPELQGRFPIRVELSSLTKDDFVKILTEPENSLVKQYRAMMQTEGIELEFTSDSIDEICEVAAEVNSQIEDIGARRLHTIMEKMLEQISFDAPALKGEKIKIDREYVSKQLSEIVKNRDLRRYIL